MEKELNFDTGSKVEKKNKKWQKKRTKKLNIALARSTPTSWRHSPQAVKDLAIIGEFAMWVLHGGNSPMQKSNSP